MKKIIVVFSLIMSLWGNEYEIIQSFNPSVCKKFQNIVNTIDIKKQSKIDYKKNSYFNWVTWDNNIKIYDTDGTLKHTKHYDIFALAEIDLNNDNSKELILKFRLQNKMFTYNESLFILPLTLKETIKKGIQFTSILKQRINFIESSMNIYLDPKNKYSKGGFALEQWEMYPIIINGSTFLLLFGRDINKLYPRIQPEGFNKYEYFKKEYFVLMNIDKLKEKPKKVCILKEKNGTK